MKAHVIKGTKQEIAERLIQISGEVREAIVFEEEPASKKAELAADASEDIFAEMRPWMVDVPSLDDSREAIYTQTESE